MPLLTQLDFTVILNTLNMGSELLILKFCKFEAHLSLWKQVDARYCFKNMDEW